MEGTELYKIWERGEYRPYPLERMIKLIAEVKKRIPSWMRIMRIHRDIPSNLIVEGVKQGDLRTLVQKRLEQDGVRCRCIRCREVGRVWYKLGLKPKPEKIELMIERYRASEGEEFFLSYEDIEQDILIGFLRLRIPSEKAHRPEIDENTGIARELHVYGPMVSVGEKAEENEWQHRGWGTKLLEEAERLVSERGMKRMVILSAIGVRPYYKRFGYKREGPYMVKSLP
jgi:elongator complex protein 3